MMHEIRLLKIHSTVAAAYIIVSTRIMFHRKWQLWRKKLIDHIQLVYNWTKAFWAFFRILYAYNCSYMMQVVSQLQTGNYSRKKRTNSYKLKVNVNTPQQLLVRIYTACIPVCSKASVTKSNLYFSLIVSVNAIESLFLKNYMCETYSHDDQVEHVLSSYVFICACIIMLCMYICADLPVCLFDINFA